MGIPAVSEDFPVYRCLGLWYTFRDSANF